MTAFVQPRKLSAIPRAGQCRFAMSSITQAATGGSNQILLRVQATEIDASSSARLQTAQAIRASLLATATAALL